MSLNGISTEELKRMLLHMNAALGHIEEYADALAVAVDAKDDPLAQVAAWANDARHGNQLPMECDQCNGTGLIAGEKCPLCDGTGKSIYARMLNESSE